VVLTKPETGTCLFPLHISIFPAAGHRLLAQYSADEGAETEILPPRVQNSNHPGLCPSKARTEDTITFFRQSRKRTNQKWTQKRGKCN